MYGGVVYSQKVLLKLVEKGYTREEAYKIVQKHALNALNEGSFKEGLLGENILNLEEINDCFKADEYLKNIESVFVRFS